MLYLIKALNTPPEPLEVLSKEVLSPSTTLPIWSITAKSSRNDKDKFPYWKKFWELKYFMTEFPSLDEQTK